MLDFMLIDRYCGSVSLQCGFIQVRSIANYVGFVILKLYIEKKDVQ